MARHKWTEERIQRFEQEGRGKGVKSSYQPWVQVGDFSSLGHARRVFSHKTGRVHHFLSDTEWRLFLLLEHAVDISDIREQFPLDRSETQSLAAELKIAHPTYPSTRVPAVMTCDFLVTFSNGHEQRLEAFSCKLKDALENPREIEKLEIERTFFSRLGIPYHLVIGSELPRAWCQNLNWCRDADLAAGLPEETDVDTLVQRFTHELKKQVGNCCLSEFCRSFDACVGAAQGTGLLIARHMLWSHVLETDFTQPRLETLPLAMFMLSGEALQIARRA